MTIKAILFDYMGTCLDWHSSVVSTLPPSMPPEQASQLALQWRQQYFDLNQARVSRNLPVEPFDDTLAKALDIVLSDQFKNLERHFDGNAKKRAIRAFHNEKAWPDVKPAIEALRERGGYEIFVHANGTTRLQLDITKSSGLAFDMLFSSELLGSIIPAPEGFLKVLKLIGAEPQEVVKVAAHAYDLRGAKRVGMKTVYVRRWTDDIEEDMEALKGEFNVFLEDMRDLEDVIKKLEGA
ncbi:HAD-like protein [Periconia macrospinosa]|uniref:HAD-like protein n=1 Tax=Periconia macrospinosa TaxID=97972 RepID=A0A2V1DDY9_9PLEO|nr:HAD-like protein [Periconia macrospinosa]